MKSFLILMLVSASAIWSGCAIDQKMPVLETVGPPMSQSWPAISTNGTLLVYSAYEVNADFSGRDVYRPEYSGYEIYSQDGKLLRRIHNNSGTILQDAVPVELPPGKYSVHASANGYGFLTIPVIVESRQTTTLHLEGGGFWPNESVFNQTNAVRLPDGQIIGWRATPDS